MVWTQQSGSVAQSGPFMLLGERKMDLTLVSGKGTVFFCCCCSFIYFGFLGPTCRSGFPCEVNFVFYSLL